MYDAVRQSGVASANDFGVAFAKVFAAASDSIETADVLNLDWIESPVGPLLAGATRDALLLLEFSERETLEEQLQALRRRFSMSIAPGGNRWLEELRRQLADYFAGQRRAFDLPLRYSGTAFQEKVWNGLLQIPYGETWSYGELALRVGDAKASRAVGMANGSNRIAILIPCHRVVNSNGTLGGYGGGSWRKQRLLDLERGQGELLAVVRGPIETYK
jgi:AraC family transcriptional regulator of adaptative response/methylated-DNA-[protein]-cysteine methyltransferase